MDEVNNVIEFGTSKIVCLIHSDFLKGRSIPSVSCVRYEGIRNNNWIAKDNLPHALKAAVESVETKCGKQLRSAVVNIPGCFSEYRVIKRDMSLPRGRVTDDDFKELYDACVPREDAQFAPHAGNFAFFMDERDDVYIDFPVGLSTRKISGFFAATMVRKDYIDTVYDLLDELRIQPVGFVGEIYAQAMHFIPRQERDKSALLLDVGYYDTNIAAVFGDSVLDKRTINQGGAHIAGDLERVLGVEPALAENLKRNHVFGIAPDKEAKVYAKNAKGRMMGFDAVHVHQILSDRVEIMAGKIKDQIEYFDDIVRSDSPIYLSGAGLSMRGAEPILQQILGRKIISVWRPSEMFSPVYNTALSLLDNERPEIYDLNENLFAGPSKKKSKLRGLFES